MKRVLNYVFSILLLTVVFQSNADAKKPSVNDSYFELKVYHFANSVQESILEKYLQNDLLPYLHSSGLDNIGVFKALANDTVADKKLYVFIPFKSLKQWEKYIVQTRTNNPALNGVSDYSNAVNDKPAYSRMETIFLHAFKFMPKLTAPKFSTPKSERVYELRNYESVGEKSHANKVHMFNEGGEVAIFSKLGFNPVFYSSVIYGSRMPNLMYMTTFENMKARDEHWAAFRADPDWKALSAKKEYQKNTTKTEPILVRPTDYSDL